MFDRVVLNKPANTAIVREFEESDDGSGMTDEHELKESSSDEHDHFANQEFSADGAIIRSLSNLAQQSDHHLV